MGRAARAIIIENGKILVMYRNKYGSEYYTLVGGRVQEHETVGEALVREVKEETGMKIMGGELMYIEKHAEPYNEQYIYLCTVAPHGDIAINEASEEGMMNKLDMNVHKLLWVQAESFGHLQFRTPQLQQAIVQALKKGFPKEPVRLA